MKYIEKTFIHALVLLHNDSRKGKVYLEDKRLSLNEKKIISAWLMLKACKHNEVENILKSIHSITSELVEGQKLLLEGILFNNTSRFKDSILKLNLSISKLSKFDIEEHIFLAFYNLFISYCNLNNLTGMKFALEQMQKIEDQTRLEKQHLKICLFNYAIAQNHDAEAFKLASIIEKNLGLLTDSTVMAYLISKFLLYIKIEDLNQAEETLEQMKKYRMFRSSSTFTYMRSLINHLLHQKPLYVYKSDYQDSDLLYYQIKTIQALEESNLSAAKKYWNELQSLNQDQYLDHFNYLGEKNLFSLGLKKYGPSLEKNANAPINKTQSHNKIDQLLFLFETTKTPIRKEKLFMELWGREMESLEDEIKLKNFLYYARKNKKIHLVFRKGCYLLSDVKIRKIA